MDPGHLQIIHAIFEACGIMVTVLLALHAYNVGKERKFAVMLREWFLMKIEHDKVMKWWGSQQNPPIKLNDLETRDEHGRFRVEINREADGET